MACIRTRADCLNVYTLIQARPRCFSVQELAGEVDAPYEVVLVGGDHMSSIDEAILDFISEIRMDMER
jgi:hypothetical protein